MTETAKVISIFLSSPSDVTEERSRFSEVVSELNTLWGKEYGCRFEIISWENTTFPAVGDNPQSIINSQIPDNYDLFVGILWKRFGTPTAQANSGTEEEFNAAYKRFLADPASVQIMFYFKNGKTDVRGLDLEQIKLVNEFIGRITNFSLYSPFEDINDFEKKARSHLSRQIQKFGNRAQTDADQERIDIIERISLRPIGDTKPDEYAEIATRKIALSISIVEELNAQINKFTSIINQQRRAVYYLAFFVFFIPGKSTRMQAFNFLWKKSFEKLAAAMRDYNIFLEDAMPKYSASIEDSLNAMLKVISNLQYEDRQHIESIARVSRESATAVTNTGLSIKHFIEAIMEIDQDKSENFDIERGKLVDISKSMIERYDTASALYVTLSEAAEKKLETM